MRRSGRLALLVLVLVLVLMPLETHGLEARPNGTEVSANQTLVLPEEAEPGRAADIVTVTGVSLDSVSTTSPRGGRVPRGGEDQGSGLFPELPLIPETHDSPQISYDSAETELLLPSNNQEVSEGEEPEGAGPEGEELHTPPPWIHNKDTAVFSLDRLPSPPPSPVPSLPSLPSLPPGQDVLKVDFFDPSSRGRGLDLAPPPPSPSQAELQGGDPTSWAVPDDYDYLTPYEEGVSPTAGDYDLSTTDSYDPRRSRSRLPPAAPPSGGRSSDGSDGRGGCRPGYLRENSVCRSTCDLQRNYCLNGGQCYIQEGNGAFCRCNVQEYVWNKGERCESAVTEFQVLCATIGASAVVLLLLFMIIVCFTKKLHLLETQNKKLRRRSKSRPSSEQQNDTFSLSTIAEGSHPNVRKLCDSPPHAPHARALAYYDNIICQSKLDDPVKAPPKEDDSLNIHNSLSPKPDLHKVLGQENAENSHNNMM